MSTGQPAPALDEDCGPHCGIKDGYLAHCQHCHANPFGAPAELAGGSIDAEDAHDLAVALAELAMAPGEAPHPVTGLPRQIPELGPPPVAVARALAVVQFLDKVITDVIRQHAEDAPHLYPDESR